MQAKALESNIWKYAVFLVSKKRIFVAILGAYYLTIPGVTPFWIGLFLLASNGASFMFDIPSSYIADRIGHKEALILSSGFVFLSTIFFLLATNVWWLVVASVLMSIGFAFASGVGNAFMHETIRALGREEEYNTIMGKIVSIGFFVPAILAALIPFTVALSYKVPFLIALVLDLVGVLVSFSLIRPPATEHAAEMESLSFIEIMRQGATLNFFRTAVFFALVAAFLAAADGFRAPYQLLLGVPVIWFGIFFGIGRVLASILLAYSGRIRQWLGDVHKYQFMQIIGYGVLLSILGLVSTPWIVVIVFIFDNGFKWGLSQVNTGYLLDIIKDSKYKATLLSTGSQLNNLFSMATAILFGISIERFGYQYSYLILALILLVVLVPFYFYAYAKKRPH